MELKQVLAILRKWWWLLLLSTGIAAIFSLIASLQTTPIYQTTTTLMVGQIIQSERPTFDELNLSQQLAQSYVQFARRQPVMQAVVDTLGLSISWEQLAAQTNVGVLPGTQLLEIRVVDTNPRRAKILADEIARQLIAQSPTPTQKQQQETAKFLASQLQDLQMRIEQATADISTLEQSLANEMSARRIQDLQDQIAAKRSQLNVWQTNYANLLTSYKGGVNTLTIIEPAAVPRVPIAPNTQQNVLVALAIGLMLALGAAFLLEYLDDTVKSPEDLQRLTGLATLASISRMPKGSNPSDQLVAAKQPKSSNAEAYRVLRTNLQFSGMKNPSGTLLVTSTLPQEGKSTTAANLAVVMAQAQKRVILVDTDLQRPSQHKIFGVSNKDGLTSLILDETLSPDDVLQPTELANLRLLTSGPLPPNPADVLNSAEMTQIIERLRERADIVIFDSPPVLSAVDPMILAGKLMSTLLVVESGRTRSDAARRSIETLNRVNAKMVGVVLNKIGTRGTTVYYDYEPYATPSTNSERGSRNWWQRRTRRNHKAPATVAKSEAN